MSNDKAAIEPTMVNRKQWYDNGVSVDFIFDAFET